MGQPIPNPCPSPLCLPHSGLRRESDDNETQVAPSLLYTRPQVDPNPKCTGPETPTEVWSMGLVCRLCGFEGTTKNPYRHLQDHYGGPGVTI